MTDSVKQYQSCGAIHIHTKFSDGTGDINSISKAAKKAGLDWIIITDHNYYDTEEGIYNGVYVIKGEEISPNGHDHYLALGINERIEPSENPQVNVDKVRELGGFGIAAHPDEGVNEGVNGRKNKWPPIVWKDKSITPDGVEIWNWFSNWGDNLDDRNIFMLAYSFFFKNKIIKAPSNKTLNWWDELNLKSDKIIPATGGVDAHALKIYKYIIPLTIYPYKDCFQTIINVINKDEPLSKDFDEAKVQILSSIKSGRNIILNKNICREIPLVYMENQTEKAFCGQKISLTPDTNLIIGTKNHVDVTIIHDGKKIKNFTNKNIKLPVTKSGNYRIEFSYKGKNYCYTNPIKVF